MRRDTMDHAIARGEETADEKKHKKLKNKGYEPGGLLFL